MKRYVKSLKTPEKISIASFHSPTIIYKDGKKINLDMKFTDSDFWEILEFDFLGGKGFSKNDVENINPVAVINEKIRKQYFNGESAVGKMIEVGGKNYRVIGVVENVSILRIMPYADIWLPITHSTEKLDEIRLMGSFPGWYAMVLAHKRSDFPKIKNEFRKHLTQVEFPSDRFNKIVADTDTYAEAISRQLFRTEVGSTSPLIIILIILMTLFMLLPTVNLVNINISRIMERSSEIGVRKAFGASSMTLVGQFIVENVIITLIGGFISLILAIIVLSMINDSGIIPHAQLTLNFRIFFYSILICLFFGFLSGVYPAYKMSRLNPAEALKGAQS